MIRYCLMLSATIYPYIPLFQVFGSERCIFQRLLEIVVIKYLRIEPNTNHNNAVALLTIEN